MLEKKDNENIDYAKQKSKEELALETDNDIAIALYKKYGFKGNNLMMVANISEHYRKENNLTVMENEEELDVEKYY